MKQQIDTKKQYVTLKKNGQRENSDNEKRITKKERLISISKASEIVELLKDKCTYVLLIME